MAMTGYYKTLVRPRKHFPLSMLKYDPVGTFLFLFYVVFLGKKRGELERGGGKGEGRQRLMMCECSSEKGVVFGTEEEWEEVREGGGGREGGDKRGCRGEYGREFGVGRRGDGIKRRTSEEELLEICTK